MKDLNNPITRCIWTVLVLQKSVGLADRGTVHFAGKGQRPRLSNERKKKQFTSKTSLRTDQDQSLMSAKGRFP